MRPFKFLTPVVTYEDLNFFAQIEYNQGWVHAREGRTIDQSPYDEEFRGNWLMGWEQYHTDVRQLRNTDISDDDDIRDFLMSNVPTYIVRCGEVDAYRTGVESGLTSMEYNPYPDNVRGEIWNRGFWNATNLKYRTDESL